MDFSEKIYEDIVKIDLIALNTKEAKKALDKCANYLNIVHRLLDSFFRQLKENPNPVTCDKVDELTFKVTSVASVQQEIFDVFLLGWEDDAIVQMMVDEGKDVLATKKATEDLQKTWNKKTNDMITNAAKAVKSAWNSLGPSAARETRWRRRQSRSPDRVGDRHTNDPPDREDKIFIASDLKPGMLSTDDDQLSLIAWKEGALLFMRASKLDKQSKETQLGYLKTLCTPELWQEALMTAEYSGIAKTDLDFKTGIDLIESNFLKKNNQYLLQLKTLSSKFKGSTATQFLTWFYTFKQKAQACRVFNLSCRQMLCLWGLKELPQALQTKVLEANSKPELDEFIRVIENIATVENMQDKNKDKSSTVNNINETTEKNPRRQVKCYRCAGFHFRSECTVPQVWCQTCSSNTHNSEACGLVEQGRKERIERGRGRQRFREERSSSGSRTSTARESSRSSSSSTSSTTSEEEKKKRRKEKKKKKKEKEDKKKKEKEAQKSRMRRNSSSTTAKSSRSASSRSRSRSRSSSRTPKRGGNQVKPKRKKTPAAPKKRRSVNAIETRQNAMTAKREVLCTAEQANKQHTKTEHTIRAVLDTGCGHFLVRSQECDQRGWRVREIKEADKPELTNPDGTPLEVTGFVKIRIKLPKEHKTKKLRCLAVKDLMNKMLIGLPTLRKLRWIPRKWPQCIEEEGWRLESDSSPSEEEDDSEEEDSLSSENNRVNAVSDWQKEESRRRRWEDKKNRSEKKSTTAPLKDLPHEKVTVEEDVHDNEEDEELECIESLLERTDYTQIPGFDSLPKELKEAIVDYKGQFSNTMKKGDSMNVKPARFKLKHNYKVPEPRGGVQLPPIHMREACDKLLDELEDAGVIEPSPPDDSEFCSRAIFIAKKGDPTKIRLAIDYLRSGVNDALIRTPHPQPTPDQLISNIPVGMQHMAVVDVKHCYHMHPIELDENCEEGEVGRSITKFSTYRGSHRLTSLAQGMKNSGDWISHALGSLQQEPLLKMDKEEGGTERCVDDILLVAPTFSTFIQKFRMLMSKCQQYGVFLNPQKLVYSTSSVKFGGCLITPRGVSQDPDRLQSIKTFSRPKSATEVRRFLGLCTSLAKFTRTLLRSTTHLRSLTVAKAPFIWTEYHEAEFNQLREEMSQPRLLSHFQPGLQLGGDVDASDSGWGGILYAYDPSKSEEPEEGNFFLLAAYSGAAPPSWRNFSTTEKEACGALHFLRKAAFYISGTTIRLRSDHKPWVQAYMGQDLLQCPNRLKRIMIEMRDFSVDMSYAPAEKLAVADALSRAPLPQISGDDPLDQLHQQRVQHGINNNDCVNNVIDQNDVLYNINDVLYSDIFRHAQNDPRYQEAVAEARKNNKHKNWRELPKGCLARSLQDQWAQTSVITNDRGESLMVIDGERLVCPQSYIPEVLKIVDIAHVGSKKALALCRNKYYWKGYKDDIIRHCQSCHVCRQHQPNFPEEPQAPILEHQIPTKPFQIISADEFQSDNDHHLMIACRFSGFSKVYTFGARRTSAKIIEMIKDWSLTYSYPETFQSDGPQVFVGEEMQNWLKKNKISHRVSSPHMPRSNGFIESNLKIWKLTKQKLITEGNYSPGAMAEAWATMMDFPSEPGELPPSRLALLQDRRNPNIPTLPGEPGEEVDIGQSTRQVREIRKAERNEKMPSNLRKPPELAIGLRILVQNKKGVFCIPAKIISIRPDSHNRSAVVEYTDGSTQIRNRRFFIEDKTQPQVNDIVANIEVDECYYFRLERVKPSSQEDTKSDDEDFVLKKVKLCKILRSCMKGCSGKARSQRRVAFTADTEG